MKFLILLFASFLGGCVGAPSGVSTVTGFNIDRYLGKWYEIARLDHRFERGLSQVTAEYSLADDGSVRVVNRGFDNDSRRWYEAIGKAYATGDPTRGTLKISFFGPFYGGYNVIKLDHENYRYSLVSGPTRSYLWILSRSPTLEPAVVNELVRYAGKLGFAVEKLIYVEQEGG